MARRRRRPRRCRSSTRARSSTPSGWRLDAIFAEARASLAGVGHHLDLAALQPDEAVLDLGSGSGTDVFCAALRVGG